MGFEDERRPNSAAFRISTDCLSARMENISSAIIGTLVWCMIFLIPLAVHCK
jgi:hypothetical protein